MINLLSHQAQCMAMELVDVEVLIIGSGPLGCTFARKILDETEDNVCVTMVDIGAQLSAKPGENLRNSVFFQSDINRFSGIMQAHLCQLSIPYNESHLPTLDPSTYQYDATKYPQYVNYLNTIMIQ